MSTVPISPTFAPTSWTMDPPHRPDYLAGAVLNSLGRPLLGDRHKPWGLIKSVILGGLSFGLLPLLMWPRRFRDFVVVEQQQLWHLAEWLRVRTGRPEAIALRDVWVPNLVSRRAFWVVPTLLVFVILFEFVPAHHDLSVMAMTYGYFTTKAPWHQLASVGHFWRVWTLLLSIGFFIHWIEVCSHTAALVDYTRKFNAVIAKEGLPPVTVRGVGVGYHPFWFLAAIFGIMHGAVWALPMALAGVVHSRYVWTTSRPVRSEFAQRVRSMLLSHRPALDVPMPMAMLSPQAVRLACGNDRCRAALPSEAIFCPRCGTGVMTK